MLCMATFTLTPHGVFGGIGLWGFVVFFILTAVVAQRDYREYRKQFAPDMKNNKWTPAMVFVCMVYTSIHFIAQRALPAWAFAIFVLVLLIGESIIGKLRG